MCQSKANGGQRCSGHALRALQNQTALYAKTPTQHRLEKVLETQAVFASTTTGHRLVSEAMKQAETAGNTQDAENLKRTLEKGSNIRARNQAIAANTRANNAAAAEKPVTVESMDAAWAGDQVTVSVPGAEGINHHIFTADGEGRWHRGTVDVNGSSPEEVLAAYAKAKKTHGASIRFGGAPGPFAHGATLPGGRGPTPPKFDNDNADASSLHKEIGSTNPKVVAQTVADLFS